MMLSAELKRESNMHIVNVDLGERSYDIVLGVKLDQAGAELKDLGFGRKTAVVTNPSVKKLYGQRIVNSLKAAGYLVMSIEIPEGEKSKTLDWVNSIYTALL